MHILGGTWYRADPSVYRDNGRALSKGRRSVQTGKHPGRGMCDLFRGRVIWFPVREKRPAQGSYALIQQLTVRARYGMGIQSECRNTRGRAWLLH